MTTGAQQGFTVEHEALQSAAAKLPRQSSALTDVRGKVTAHQVAGESFGKVDGSPTAASTHRNTIEQLAQNLGQHARRLDEITQGVSTSDAEVKAFDDQQAGKQEVQGAAVPGADIIHHPDHDGLLITPTNKDWAPFELPNTAGTHEGFTVNTPPGWFDSSHTYSVTTPTSIPWAAGRDELTRALVENPTPGTDTPATPDGSTNDALGFGQGHVSSYVVPSQDPAKYTDMVVNYTQPDHVLYPGYVLRRGVLADDGTITIQSWGEGRGFLQNWTMSPIADPAGWAVWEVNQLQIKNTVLERMHLK